jgi:hypothetical protein
MSWRRSPGGDTDRLLAHGRFLEDRFARSEMDLG